MQTKEFEELLNQAQQAYLQNFANETCFERAIFFSWDCSIKDCGFCYMSAHTKRKTTKIARRSTASILAEAILCKKLGWEIGFISGGINAYTQPELKDLLEKIHITYGQKVWLNAGPITLQRLKQFQPYICGVIGSIETTNPKIHKKICPSKPTKPYEQMFTNALKLNLQNAITLIIGVGETIKDFELLKQFIQKYQITKIHFYGLIPHKGTMFENAQPPTAEYQAEWIAKTRTAFPQINIQCGIWQDRTERIPLLLKAGSNSISKFSAIQYFATKTSNAIEQQAKKAGRNFKGTLTQMPQINTIEETDKLPFDKTLKQQIKNKLEEYIQTMTANKTKCKQ